MFNTNKGKQTMTDRTAILARIEKLEFLLKFRSVRVDSGRAFKARAEIHNLRKALAKIDA